jgi:hypothetical protein
MLQAGRSRVRIPMKWNFSSFQPHYGPGVDSASNRNEYQEHSWGDKGRPARKVDNLTAICEPIVYILWDPQRLTILWASMASYRDSFTLPFYLYPRSLRRQTFIRACYSCLYYTPLRNIKLCSLSQKNIVAYRPVARQRLRYRRDNSRCYAMAR